MTSKAERRSLTTKSKVSPRSKTSRTLPLRSFLIPGSLISESICISANDSRVGVCRASAPACRSAFGSRHGRPTIVAMAGIVVRPRARILHGHDWVFSSEVLKMFGNPADGDVISIKDGRDRMLGSAIWNSKSQIVARRFSHRRQDLDLDFFKRRIAQAAEYRERRKVNPQLHRVVWSESDGLPGVILDRYGDQFVLQLTTLGMDQRKEILVDAIGEVLEGRNIIERSDAAGRRAEGLPQRSGILRGEARETEFEIGGVKFSIDLLRAQKTGFYLDQISHSPVVAEFARGRRVLDCFSNEGAFALTCARAGAREVIGVEMQARAIAAARDNSKRNQLPVRWVEQDVFGYFRAAQKAVAQFDFMLVYPRLFQT